MYQLFLSDNSSTKTNKVTIFFSLHFTSTCDYVIIAVVLFLFVLDVNFMLEKDMEYLALNPL